MERRNFLKIAGSSAVILAAGAGGWSFTRAPAAARAPWHMAGGADYTDPRVRALSYAILAPNPHNRQPWVVDLSVPGEATLTCDLGRLLPETDPYDRQIVIGLGCFTELLRLAAGADGYRVHVTPFPDGQDTDHLDRRPIAHFRFVEDHEVPPDPLFDQVLRRRTNRNTYDTARAVSDEALEGLRRAAGASGSARTTNDPAMVQALRDLTDAAFETELRDPAAMGESIDLMRIGKAEINANPDGLSMGGPVLDALGAAGILTRTTLADPNSTAFQQGLQMGRDQAQSAMAHVWLLSPRNSRVDQLLAGVAWVRVNLKATELGLSLQPMSQALQEYDAMADHFAALYEMLGIERPGTIQMLGRLGYSASVPPAPRWPVETRLTGV